MDPNKPGERKEIDNKLTTIRGCYQSSLCLHGNNRDNNLIIVLVLLLSDEVVKKSYGSQKGRKYVIF